MDYVISMLGLQEATMILENRTSPATAKLADPVRRRPGQPEITTAEWFHHVFAMVNPWFCHGKPMVNPW